MISFGTDFYNNVHNYALHCAAHHKGQKSMKTILIIQSSCRQVLVRLRKEFTWVMKKRGSKSTEGGPGPGPGPDARRKGPNRHAGGAGKARGRPRGGSRASGQFKSTGKSLIAQQRAIGPCEVVYAYQSTQLRSHVCPYCTVPVDEQVRRFSSSRVSIHMPVHDATILEP